MIIFSRPRQTRAGSPIRGTTRFLTPQRLRGRGRAVSANPGGALPRPVAPPPLLFGPGYKRAYVAGVRAGGMFVVDAEKRSVITRIPTGRTAHAATPSWDGSRIWGANVGGNNILEVMASGDSYTKGRTIATDPRPSCAFWSKDDSTFWVVTGGAANAPPGPAGAITRGGGKGGPGDQGGHPNA